MPSCLAVIFFFLSFLKKIMCTNVLPECMSVHHKYAWCLRRSEKYPGPLELELESIGSHHVDAET